MSFRTGERRNGSKYRYPLMGTREYVPLDLYIQRADELLDDLSCEEIVEKISDMRRILRVDFGGTISENPKARELLGEIAVYEEDLMRRCPKLYDDYLRETRSKRKIEGLDNLKEGDIR